MSSQFNNGSGVEEQPATNDNQDQFNNHSGVEEQQATNDYQDVFESDLEWEIMAAEECDKIELGLIVESTKDKSFQKIKEVLMCN